jgi:phage terminase large subunit
MSFVLDNPVKQLFPAKASNFLGRLSETDRATLLKSGIAPVNNKFFNLWQDPFDILVAYGGRGGGKSQEIAQLLLNKALTHKYFKCYFGRKVYDDVRDTCFATLVQCIKDLNLKRYFHFSEAQTSSMVITCYNGNKFMPFGASDAKQLKSIKDPTHFWLEEADQFTFEDLTEIYPTLRTLKGENQLLLTFNAYAVLPKHHLMKIFFPQLAQYDYGEARLDTAIFDKVNIKYLLVNYTDNYFIDHEKYSNILRLISAGNERLYQGLANGSFGAIENNMPWLYNFDDAKHIKDVPFLPGYPLYLSFDFNVNPFACTIWQMSPQKGTKDSFVHCIDEVVGRHKIEDMCHIINDKYPASIKYITGDRSGQNEDIGRNQSLYQMIAGYLGVSDKCLHLNTVNLEHSDSQILCNMMMFHYPNLYIHPRCSTLINDCRIATIDTDKNKPSQLKKDRESFKLDAFDAMRYLFQTYFHEYMKNTYMKFVK